MLSLRFQGPRLHTLKTSRPSNQPSGSGPRRLEALRRRVPASFPAAGRPGRQLRPAPSAGASTSLAPLKRRGVWALGALPALLSAAFPQRSSRVQNRAEQSEPRGASGERSAPNTFHHVGYLLHGNILIRAQPHFYNSRR